MRTPSTSLISGCMASCAQIAELKGQLAAAHAEVDANAARVADAASAHAQVDWLHSRLQSSMEEIQVSCTGP